MNKNIQKRINQIFILTQCSLLFYIIFQYILLQIINVMYIFTTKFFFEIKKYLFLFII